MSQRSSEYSPLDRRVLADALADVCGADHVLTAGGPLIARPADAEQVASVMWVATGSGATVAIRGSGTKASWGAPPTPAEVVLDLSRMATVLEHVAGDLVVRVQPGVTLSDLAAHLAPAGQRLGIDEVVPGSTIGGVVATGLSGPSRLVHGAVRDLLIGVTVVMADGTTTHSGGKVVKNVAGYDLAKLYAGSYGTLGAIVEAVFRLHPLPERREWVSATYPDEPAAGAALAGVYDSQVVPAGIEVDRPSPDGPIQVTVALEGISAGMDHRVDETGQRLGAGADVSSSAPAWWGVLPGARPRAVNPVVKVTAEISQVPAVLRALRVAATPTIRPEVRGSAGLGIVYAGLPEDSPTSAVADLLAAARGAAFTAGGSAILLCGPSHIAAELDVWGPVNGLALMRRVKDVFDPAGRLAPGRFVGGI